MSKKPKSRWQLLLTVGLFLLAPVAASLLWMSGWRPVGTRNEGVLIHPVRSLTAIEAKNASGEPYEWALHELDWRVLLVPRQACGPRCEQEVIAVRQVWTSLGRKADRVRVIWLAEDAPPAALTQAFPQLQAVRAEKPASRAEFADAPAEPEVTIWLVDPQGYLFMNYPGTFEPAKLKKDLGRLLK